MKCNWDLIDDGKLEIQKMKTNLIKLNDGIYNLGPWVRAQSGICGNQAHFQKWGIFRKQTFLEFMYI